MDSTSQTSFIPKKPIGSGPVSYESRGVSIVTILCVIVFFGSVGLAVGSFLYKGILNKQLENKKETLEKAKQGFELDTIEDLKRLDNRINTARGLLEQHLAVSAYFALLEEATLKSISFSNFRIRSGGSSVSATPTDGSVAPQALSQQFNFEMTGLAKSYESVALQAKVFTDSKKFKEPIVSGITLDQSGNVTFTVSAKVDTDALLYRDSFKAPASANGSASVSTTTKQQ